MQHHTVLTTGAEHLSPGIDAEELWSLQSAQWICGGQLTIAAILLGSVLIQLLEMLWPRKATILRKNWLFQGCILRWASYNLVRTSHRCCRFSSLERPNTTRSSMYARHISQLRPFRTSSTSLWNVIRALHRAKRIIRNWKKSHFLVKAVFSQSAGSTSTCQYHLCRSKVENQQASQRESIRSSTLDKG